MVPFRYFLMEILLIPFALSGVNLSCTNEIDVEEICCGGDVYRLGDSISPDASCNIEPKNQTLTIADSAWLAYDCNTLGEDEYDKIQAIKLFHRESLKAVEQACTFGDGNSTSESTPFDRLLATMNFTTRFSRIQFSNLGNATYYKLRTNIYKLCLAIRFKHVFSEGENLVNKHVFVSAMMIFQIADVFQKTAMNVCRLDASRKENTGM
ncbi:unnamed protein product [Allacma fusca]|uniref:Uncharacterized protein n=1 Tax=Allacma fusca TaxID=39272 RepID=A0A8J2JEV8_9HEXA|nr:unnamed protein product [Allacma fusca]